METQTLKSDPLRDKTLNLAIRIVGLNKYLVEKSQNMS